MYIAVDMGGTNTRVAISLDLEEILDVAKFKTSKDLSEQKEELRNSIELLLSHQQIQGFAQIKGIAMGIAGILSKDKLGMEYSPNILYLKGIKLASLFPDDCNAAFKFENDAALAGLGEAVMGAGKNFASVAYVSLGTGVGGVKVFNKKLSIDQVVFEPGHQIINFDDDFCDTAGVAGSAETYLSGKGFYRMFKKNPLECKDVLVWKTYGEVLGALLINVSCMWNPEIIVIGGGMAEHYEKFIEGAKNKLGSTLLTYKPVISKNTFGEGSALIGGFHLLKKDR